MTENEDDVVVSATSTPLECIVCLETLETDSAFRLETCGHSFHATCIHEWIRRSGTCPYCRTSITHRQKLYSAYILSSSNEPSIRNMMNLTRLTLRNLLDIASFFKPSQLEQVASPLTELLSDGDFECGILECYAEACRKKPDSEPHIRFAILEILISAMRTIVYVRYWFEPMFYGFLRRWLTPEEFQVHSLLMADFQETPPRIGLPGSIAIDDSCKDTDLYDMTWTNYNCPSISQYQPWDLPDLEMQSLLNIIGFSFPSKLEEITSRLTEFFDPFDPECSVEELYDQARGTHSDSIFGFRSIILELTILATRTMAEIRFGFEPLIYEFLSEWLCPTDFLLHFPLKGSPPRDFVDKRESELGKILKSGLVAKVPDEYEFCFDTDVYVFPLLTFGGLA